jgi:hypothetical protein
LPTQFFTTTSTNLSQTPLTAQSHFQTTYPSTEQRI